MCPKRQTVLLEFEEKLRKELNTAWEDPLLTLAGVVLCELITSLASDPTGRAALWG